FAALRRGALELGRTLIAARRLSPRLEPQPHSRRPAAPPEGLAVRLASARVCHQGATSLDVSLAVRAAERVAIIGPSGAGKSTLLALIAGEIAPDSGSVEAARGTLLTQRTELFRDSLRENLRLAAPDAED